MTKSKVKVEAIPFAEFSATQKGIGRAAAGFGQYLGLPAEVVDAKSPSQTSWLACRRVNRRANFASG